VERQGSLYEFDWYGDKYTEEVYAWQQGGTVVAALFQYRNAELKEAERVLKQFGKTFRNR
jgi:hypothetical protein